MALQVLIGIIQTALTTTLAGFTPPQAPPTYRFGEDQLAIEDDAPRICWVPRRASTDRNIIPAADFPPTFGQAPPGAAFPNPGPLWRRKLLVEAHVWAVRPNFDTDPDTSKDYGAAEALANHLVAAIQNVCFGAYEISGESWTTAQGSSQRKGIVCVLQAVLYVPWTREQDATAVVAQMPIIPEGT